MPEEPFDEATQLGSNVLQVMVGNNSARNSRLQIVEE